MGMIDITPCERDIFLAGLNMLESWQDDNISYDELKKKLTEVCF